MFIKESFIKLLKQKPISKISIKELCDDAEINRTTFYSHYSDQYDLLRQIEQEVITDFNKYINDHMTCETSETTIQLLIQLLEYAAKNSDLFEVLLSDNGGTEFQKALLSITQERLIPSFQNNKNLNERTLEYLQVFVIAGMLRIVQKWLEDGTIESTQQMAKLISKLLFKGISSYF